MNAKCSAIRLRRDVNEGMSWKVNERREYVCARVCVFGFRHKHGVFCLRNCLWNKTQHEPNEKGEREGVCAYVIMADTITSESCVKSFSYQFPFPLRYVSLFAPVRMVNSEHINCSSTWQHLCSSRSLARSLYLSWGVFVHCECFALHCVYHVPFSDSQHIHICQTCLLTHSFVWSVVRLCPHIRFAPIYDTIRMEPNVNWTGI